MSDTERLSRLMRDDWNRRITHDYRYWMSDGYESDESMFKTGKRDFAVLTKGIEQTERKTLLEIGCGVGRLLRAAAPKYLSVIGLDVSSEALKKAGEFLANNPRVELKLGDGLTLGQVETASIDIVTSFAAITSTPVTVFASYLAEMHRVLKDDGIIRLQLYLGTEQQVRRDDTLHLRCYPYDNFKKAAELAGLELEWVEDLILPFETSSIDENIIAKIVSLKKSTDREPSQPQEIADALIPGGEGETTISVSGAELEYWMALQYAKELAEKGDIYKAKESLEYAYAHSKNTTLDVKDILDQIVSKIEKGETQAQNVGSHESATPLSPSECFEKNLRVLEERFPDIYQRIREQEKKSSVIEVRQSEQGPVLFYAGQCLDHPTKPISAASRWFKTALPRTQVEQLVIYGFAAGYHIEGALELSEGKVAVIEPSLAVFCEALRVRDLTEVLSKISHLTIGEFDRAVLESECELLVRPQTQTVSAELCAEIKSAFYGARGLSKLQPSVTVLGPIYGGTLPITGYTSRALQIMKQRVRTVDMSPFKEGFSALEGYVTDEMRQGFIRGKYTEALSEIILEIANEKPMDILICMAQAPITGETLNELRKRGVITVLWFVEDYLRFNTWKYMSQFYDFIFTIQKGECVEAIRAAGAGDVHYLPTACDPGIHAPIELSDEEKARWGSPISFVGAGYHNRQQVFASLSEYPLKLWGTEWPHCKPFDRMVQEEGRRLTPEEYIKIFNATDININLHSSTERDGVDPYGDFLNPRTFELASCGAFQMVDERQYLRDVLEPGKEVVTFSSRADLVEKIHHYMDRPEQRAKIAAAGRERVLKEHTYTHRLEQMLSYIYSSKYEQLKRKSDNSPWQKTLKRAEPHKELHERCKKSYERGEEPNLDGLVSDIVSGEGKLSETESKLLFLYHIKKQMVRMRHEEKVK